jgi:hypothetical protein
MVLAQVTWLWLEHLIGHVIKDDMSVGSNHGSRPRDAFAREEPTNAHVTWRVSTPGPDHRAGLSMGHGLPTDSIRHSHIGEMGLVEPDRGYEQERHL